MGYKRLLHHPKASVQAGIGARKDWEASCPPIGRGAGRAAPITSADFAENRETDTQTHRDCELLSLLGPGPGSEKNVAAIMAKNRFLALL